MSPVCGDSILELRRAPGDQQQGKLNAFLGSDAANSKRLFNEN